MNPQPSNSFLGVEMREDVLIARFTRQMILSGDAAEAVAERLGSLLSEPGPKRLLIDFGNVESLTSFMLGRLIMLNRAAEAGGRRLALFNLSPEVRQILEVARLNLFLALYDDESAALRGC